jgi:dihydroxy-acid dehydratase
MGFEKEINLELFEQFGQETPCITAVRPSGPYTMGDFDEAGGIQVVMKGIEKFLNKEVMTVTGQTLEDNLSRISVSDSPVIKNLENPVNRGGLAILGKPGKICCRQANRDSRGDAPASRSGEGV